MMIPALERQRMKKGFVIFFLDIGKTLVIGYCGLIGGIPANNHPPYHESFHQH